MMPNVIQQATKPSTIGLLVLIACTVVYGYFLIPTIAFAFEIGSTLFHPSYSSARPLLELIVVKLLLSFLVFFPVLILFSIVGGWLFYRAKRIRAALSLQLLPAPVLIFGICLLLVQELPWRINSLSLLFPHSATDYQKIGDHHYLSQEYPKAIIDFTKEIEAAELGSREYMAAHANRARAQVAQRNFGAPEFYAIFRR